jgi:hypothetical protein
MIEEYLSVELDFATTSTIPSSAQEVGVFTTQLLVTRFVTVLSDNILSRTLKTIALHSFLKVLMIFNGLLQYLG